MPSARLLPMYALPRGSQLSDGVSTSWKIFSTAGGSNKIALGPCPAKGVVAYLRVAMIVSGSANVPKKLFVQSLFADQGVSPLFSEAYIWISWPICRRFA